MVQFYLDLNLTGAVTGVLPDVPTALADDTISGIPIAGVKGVSVDLLKNVFLFKPSTTDYNWDDPTSGFHDISFNIGDATAITNLSNAVIAADAEAWRTQWTCKERNQYESSQGNGYNSASPVTEYNHNGVQVVLQDCGGGSITGAKSSLSVQLANEIAHEVFGHKLAYDIFDNEKVVFESCTNAVANATQNIGPSLTAFATALTANGANGLAATTETAAQKVGNQLIGRMLDEDPGRFKDTDNLDYSQTGFLKIPFAADDQIFIKINELKVTYTDPLSGTAGQTVSITNKGNLVLVCV